MLPNRATIGHAEMQTTSVPVLDSAKLQRHTMGDPSLEVEVLALFVAEAERLMRQVENAPNAEIRGDRLHAMIGLSRNIGAVRLAQAAREVETQITADQPDLEPLRTAVAETLAYLRQSNI
jgi:HPt (histidine-containing phosphotransfer) domain-containing protein